MPRTQPLEALRRPWALWWAVVLAVFFATAPTLSHALAYASGDGRFEICSAQALKVTALGGAASGQSSNGQESNASFALCPFCVHPSDRLAPPPQRPACVFMVMGAPREHTLWRAFFYADKTLVWARPRGPPASRHS